MRPLSNLKYLPEGARMRLIGFGIDTVEAFVSYMETPVNLDRLRGDLGLSWPEMTFAMHEAWGLVDESLKEERDKYKGRLEAREPDDAWPTVMQTIDELREQIKETKADRDRALSGALESKAYEEREEALRDLRKVSDELEKVKLERDVLADYIADAHVDDPDSVAKIRKLLKHWDDGLMSLGEFECKVHDIFLEPFLKNIEAGKEVMRFGSCCCYGGHPPDRTLHIDFTIEPHGYRAKRVDPIHEEQRREVLATHYYNEKLYAMKLRDALDRIEKLASVGISAIGVSTLAREALTLKMPPNPLAHLYDEGMHFGHPFSEYLDLPMRPTDEYKDPHKS